MDISSLTRFLKSAKKNTYASTEAKEVASQRLASKDYEYTEGDFLYHDTYFGGGSFIGGEIVYENGKPIWGMNYCGTNVVENVTEAEINKSLRGALRHDFDDIIPVRGPRIYKIDNFEYRNNINGDLSRFDGREEIFRDGKLIYAAVFHGGLIK